MSVKFSAEEFNKLESLAASKKVDALKSMLNDKKQGKKRVKQDDLFLYGSGTRPVLVRL
jgi:hypothetical protein